MLQAFYYGAFREYPAVIELKCSTLDCLRLSGFGWLSVGAVLVFGWGRLGLSRLGIEGSLFKSG